MKTKIFFFLLFLSWLLKKKNNKKKKAFYLGWQLRNIPKNQEFFFWRTWRCTIPTYNKRWSELVWVGAPTETHSSLLSLSLNNESFTARHNSSVAYLFYAISYPFNIFFTYLIFHFISIHLYLQNPWCTLNPLIKEKNEPSFRRKTHHSVVYLGPRALVSFLDFSFLGFCLLSSSTLISMESSAPVSRYVARNSK